MKISVKLLVIILFLAIIPLTIVGVTSYIIGSRSIENTINDNLTSSNTLKGSELDSWLNDSMIMLRSLARRFSLRDYTEVLLSDASSSILNDQAKNELRINNFQPVILEGRYIDLFLIDAATGRVLISSQDEENEGLDKSGEDYFREGKSKTFVQNPYQTEEQDLILMTVSTPVFDENGELIAVLAGNLDFNEIQEITNRQSGLYESTETYLLNDAGYFITSPNKNIEILKKEGIQPDLNLDLQNNLAQITTIIIRASRLSAHINGYRNGRWC